MSGTTLAAGVPHCWPSPSGPEFLHIQYWGTINVVDHSTATLSRLEAVGASSPVCLSWMGATSVVHAVVKWYGFVVQPYPPHVGAVTS